MTRELEEFLPDDEDSDEKEAAFVDPAARTVGEVMLGANSFVFPGSMIKGERSEVKIGEGSILMNNSSIQSTEQHPTTLEDRTFISPGADLRGCSIGKGSMVGIDAVVLDGAEVGENAIVGTNAIVPEGKKIPDGKLAMGQPAEIVRDVTEEEFEKIKQIRSDLMDKRKEFKMIEKRAERFKVNETPKRPREILEENKPELSEKNENNVPNLDDIREELKEKSEDDHVF
ncbi:MAG: gamma carbonic anhydrase family protein [Thermoplasmata archaeon]